jgi:hypothetical protein
MRTFLAPFFSFKKPAGVSSKKGNPNNNKKNTYNEKTASIMFRSDGLGFAKSGSDLDRME